MIYQYKFLRDHGLQYGGNPVSCAIAIAVMDTVDSENLMENARNVGDYLLSNLKSMRDKFPDVIGDVRGVGLFLGIELIKDPKAKTPATDDARDVVNRYSAETLINVLYNG